MATVGQRQFQDGAHKYVSIANEELSRTFRFGNNWKNLRLIFRIALTPNGTSSIAATRLVSGVCYSTVAGSTYNAVNTRNFVGLMHGHADEAAGLVWNYTANSGNPYYSNSATNGRFLQRYNGVSSSTGANGGQLLVSTNTGTIQRRTLVGGEYWKPGATGGHGTSLQSRILDLTAAATMNVDFDNFFFRDTLSSAATVAGSATFGSAQQLAPAVVGGEGSYPLDTATIFWNQASYPMEIYDMIAVRFS
jgi:hypothetical protein